MGILPLLVRQHLYIELGPSLVATISALHSHVASFTNEVNSRLAKRPLGQSSQALHEVFFLYSLDSMFILNWAPAWLPLFLHSIHQWPLLLMKLTQD